MPKAERSLAVLCLTALVALGAGAAQTGFKNTILDFKSGVVDFRDDGLPGSFSKGLLVNPSPAELQKGDVFVDVDGVARMVAAVTKVGGDIYVDTVQPEFQDVFLYAEIPYQTIAFNQDNALPEFLARSARAGGALVSFEYELYNKPPSKAKFSASLNADVGSVSIGFKVPSCVQFRIRTWKFWEWRISFRYESGYIQGSFNYDLNLQAQLAVALEKSWESAPKRLYGFGTPGGSTSAGLGLYGKLSLEGKLELALPLSFHVYGDAGARCTLNGQFPYMIPTDFSRSGGMNYRIAIDPSLTAEAKFKPKIYLGAEVSLLGIKVTEFEAGGGPYLKLSGSAAFHIVWDTALNPRLSMPTGDLSISGELGVFIGISGKVMDGKWSVNVLDLEFPIWTFLDESTAEKGLNAGFAAAPAARPILIGAN
jgi:hypothetical protein